MGKPFTHLHRFYLYFSMSVFIILLSLSPIVALTGSIGNARMVLRVQAQDTIEKCILVKNINNEDVKIEVSVSGELADDIILKEKSFIIPAQKEKNTCFTLTVPKEGTTESKINIKFISLVDGNGVGLSSTIIVVAGKEESFFDSIFGNDAGNETGSANPTENEPFFDRLPLKFIIISISTIILAVILIGLLLVLYRKKKTPEAAHFSESTKLKKERKITHE